MIQTNFITICGSASSQTIDVALPSGVISATLLLAPEWATISNSGRITATVSEVGIYNILISYTIGEGSSAGTFIEPFYIQVVNCQSAPVKSNYKVCIGSGQSSVLFRTIPSFSDFAAVTPVSGITVNANGLIEIETDVIPEAGVTVEIEWDGGSKNAEVFIQAVECALPDLLDVGDCPHEPIGIVWVNQAGGRQSYWFNGIKSYGIEQKDSQQFINSDNELRYFNRGRVENVFSASQQYIPESHLNALISLKNSIQAWACTDMEDESTYKSIIVDEESFDVRRTDSRFLSMEFNFRYSKQILIQRQ